MNSGVLLKEPSGNVMRIHPDSKITSSLDLPKYELRLKPPDGPLTWVTLSELIEACASKLKPENNLFNIRDIIEASSFKLPRQGLTNRERKLAALMGLKEFVSGPETATVSGRVRVYEPRAIKLDTPIESLRKRKLDLIIDFLKSEKGEKFLEHRPSWYVFRSAFDAWRFGYNKNTIRKYRSLTKKQADMQNKIQGEDWVGLDGRFVPPAWLDGQFLLPDFINEYSFKDVGDWLSLPTVPADRRK
jgi:hypothetical protein